MILGAGQLRKHRPDVDLARSLAPVLTSAALTLFTVVDVYGVFLCCVPFGVSHLPHLCLLGQAGHPGGQQPPGVLECHELQVFETGILDPQGSV